MNKPDCIFCKIVKGEIPCDKVYEDKDFLVFLDINPVNYGHLLVIPKEHYKDIQETPDNLIEKIFILSKKLMRELKEATKADYVTLSIVGLDVLHLHIHLVPRFNNDGMHNFWPTKKYKDDKSRKDIKEKIIKEIK